MSCRDIEPVQETGRSKKKALLSMSSNSSVNRAPAMCSILVGDSDVFFVRRTTAHGQLYCSYKVSPILCWTYLRITNHSKHKFAPSLTLLLFKTRIKWPEVLTATACFPSVFFQLLQYARQHPSFLPQKRCSDDKTDLVFPAFSLRFVDFIVLSAFAVSFHSLRNHLSQIWQWREFSGLIKIPCYAQQPMRLLHFI